MKWREINAAWDENLMVPLIMELLKSSVLCVYTLSLSFVQSLSLYVCKNMRRI